MTQILQGTQMLFVAFGALVLVPLLTGLDPSVALFGAGVGTLLFQFITRHSVPIFLASSFVFIAPIMYGVQTWGVASTIGGLMCAGLVYICLGALIKVRGVAIIHKLLPPVVVGPVIMVIDLGLAPVAVNMALGKTGDGAVQLVDGNAALIIASASLATTIAISVFARGFLKLLPIFGGIAGDGVATMAASMVGAPPNTTYSEVTGAVMLTKAYNPVIMTWAAITAIVLALVGKLGALLQTIPVPVMGGIMILLFGSIATVGLNTLIKNHVDLHKSRNLVIVAVTLVFGIGGMAFGVGEFSLQGVSLCGIVAILLNLILPKDMGQTPAIDSEHTSQS
jgi:xanthine/uracil permease